MIHRSAIRDLCIALAHRWEPGRIFVILTAFLDESGTHGGDGTPGNPASEATVMAGMMATAQQWARFAGNANALRHRYGFRNLHMKDFISKQGDFAGWSPEKQVTLIGDLGSIIQAPSLMEGVTYRVDNKEYLSDFIGERPKKVALDSAYGFCFRNCMVHLAFEAERRLGHHKKWEETKLHFVLESGHKNAGDALRVFNEMKGDFEAQGINLLGTISFMSKKESIELMVGDFLAYTAWKMDRLLRTGEASEPQLFGGNVRGNSNITHIRNIPGSLGRVRDEFLQRAQDRKRLKADRSTKKKPSHSISQGPG